ncbi:MAG: type I restriction endonuclease subunit R [Oscillatoriales cyanobacterium]|nr:MAG: type I restriction endonuclease subunit R [Oscillatoriales cyanobacterium]
MSPTAIRELITSLEDVETQLGLIPNGDDAFFAEAFPTIDAIADSDRSSLDQLRDRFLYHWRSGKVDEGIVNLLVISPLLELAGFYDPPFRMRAEVPVTVESQVEGTTLRGRIDFLVIHQRFWRAIIESKDTTYDVSMALPQTLAYMAGTVQNNLPLYGVVTNGSHFLFLKVQKQDEQVFYGLSDEFALRSRPNALYSVLSILRQLAHIIADSSTVTNPPST